MRAGEILLIVATPCSREGSPDGQAGAEVLMTGFILADELRTFAHGAFHVREQVCQCLCVVPDMRAASVATAVVATAAFPTPKTAKFLKNTVFMYH